MNAVEEERTKSQPSLENLIEEVDLGFEILHPGGLEITRELAGFCGVESGSLVLDVASGTGESACFLAEELGARVSGVDGAELMVQRARQKAAGKGLSIEFRLGDAHHLPFDSDSFDAVISECTMCILEKERAIREMKRVARPGGWIGFHDICWRSDTPARMKERLAEIEGERPETLAGWKALMERAGLIDVRAVDRSELIPPWMKETMSRLSLRDMLRMGITIVRKWGLAGGLRVWESERIFQSKYTGYGILAGRKPVVPRVETG